MWVIQVKKNPVYHCNITVYDEYLVASIRYLRYVQYL